VPVKRTPFDLDHAVQLYRSGKTLQEVGAALGVTLTLVWKRFNEAGIDRRCGGGGPQPLRVTLDDSEIIRRYRAGESEKALSEAFRVDRSTIRTRLRRGGVEPRGRSEALTQRWTDLDNAGRDALVAAAHVATRGRIRTDAEIVAAAQTRESLTCFTSPWEVVLADLLAERGMSTHPQQAAGHYNIDLAAWPVAVEVHRATGHPLSRRKDAQRAVYLLDHGWRLLYVWIDPQLDRLDTTCADHVVALTQLAEGDPSAFGEYRVVEGAFDHPPRRRAQHDYLADVRRLE
jgi:very-short-patch-repair endonuclease